MQKFEFLQQPLLGELAMSPEEEERERGEKKFRYRRWGSSLPGLRTRDPPHILFMIILEDSIGEKFKNHNWIDVWE